MSKVPLDFKAERLKEHTKPTGVEVEELETLAGSLEVERLVCEEIIDSRRVLQCISHTEMKVIARRIKIEEPSRLITRRKPLEESLQVEMLRHTARIDALALEIFCGCEVSAINVLFEDSSSKLMRALDVGTCAESPAMLTKQSHMTALHVVATHAQVILHTDDASVIGQLCKIAAIEGYEEWGEKGTVWKLPRLQAMATSTRATTAASSAIATMTTTGLCADRRPYKIECAVRWERDTASAIRDTELDGSPSIDESSRMDNERNSSSFYFRFANFYLQLHCIRIDDDVEEGMHLYTVQQRISKLQQDARDARSIEAMPSGLEGPSLSFLFKPFYLQLPHFRDREFLQSINEPLSVNVPTVQRSRSGRPVTTSLQDEDAYITVDRSELVGRHVVEQLAKGDSIPVSDIVQRHHEVSFYLGDITDERGVLDILKKLGITYIVQNALLPQGAKDLSIYVKINIEGTGAVVGVAIAASVHRLVHTSSASVTFDGTDVMNINE
ncbi:hypothetical protein M404DRAFT_31764 [Pisolithus tinctorius Marx 270]|uniref:3-beta hydroxysteroid dehydrogenase/isomerase domain-containing protein n=1 Tax=Pisolithus tinctorius Marx 270 TaxID=870435 RepID=A0A0C3NRN9_PISTI|nr:hypothetical protein M404DRAFT_31764 [Pisolithus tinctorius Marx 270]